MYVLAPGKGMVVRARWRCGRTLGDRPFAPGRWCRYLRYWSWYYIWYILYIIYDIDVISVNIFYTLIKTYLFTEHLCWSCLQTWPWRGKDACEGFFYPSSLDLPKRSSAMASSAIFAICKSANWAETAWSKSYQSWQILTKAKFTQCILGAISGPLCVMIGKTTDAWFW